MSFTVEVTDGAGQSVAAPLSVGGLPEPPPPPPPPPGGAADYLVPVWWDGLALNPGWLNGTVAIVERVEGWYSSPPMDGHDVTRALTDGVAFGPKTLGARTITVTGAASGPRGDLMQLRDLLAVRAVDRAPTPFSVDDPDTGTLTADVRADAEAFSHEWLAGHKAFRYSVVLTAADPRLYGGWREVTLTTTTDAPTGRHYDRVYPWRYAAGVLGNQATLDNPGSAYAPVFALYTGRLQNAVLSDGVNSISLTELLAGVQVLVNTETLQATAYGGATRASYVLPNSQPMTLPPRSVSTWTLYGTQGGTVTLAWRPAWL